MSLQILYQSEDCIVVNKEIGEAVEGVSPDSSMVNLTDKLKNYLNVDFAEAVHRVDVPVTGCVLFALTPEALSFLNSAFANHFSAEKKVIKRYWVIVEKPDFKLPKKGKLVHWIVTNTEMNKSFANNDDKKGGKKATLKYRLLGEGKNYLFIEAQLLSGRHHQIRAQFAAAGLHIKGDLKYGAKRSEKNGGIRLHARFISFPDPKPSGGIINVTADPPQMDALWEAVLAVSD